MAFETYAPRTDKKSNNKVAISKNHITLTPELAGKIKGKNVELAYDAENKVIRIKSVQEGKGLGISKNKIGAKGFLAYFNLQLKGKYEGKYDDKEKAIFVQI